MKAKSNKAKMPNEHYEKNMGMVDVSKPKYASKDTMNNPEDLKRSADGLASFVKKHREKF